MVIVSSSFQRPSTRQVKENALRQQDAYQKTLASNQLSAQQQIISTQQANARQNYSDLQSGKIDTATYNQNLTSQRSVAGAAADRAAGYQQTLNQDPTYTYNQMTNPLVKQPAGEGGVIEQNARDRLAEHGIQGDAANQRISGLQPAIQDTMENTGLGVQFDSKTGRVIAGSGRLEAGQTRLRNNPVQDANDAKKAQLESDLNSIKGYVKQTYTDEDGNVHEQYVEDPNATAQARQNAKNAQAQQNAADAQMAAIAQENMARNAPVPTPDSLLTSLPQSQQGDASSIYGPLFDYFGQQGNRLQSGLQHGLNALDQMDQITADYTNKANQQNDMMFRYFNELNKNSLDRRLEAAEITRDAQERAAEADRQRQEQLYNRAIRDQISRNEEDRKNQLLGLGISGGWRASRQTASVISALKKGEDILSDLYADQSYASSQSALKVQEIESNYHTNVLDAYDKYDAANGNLFSTMLDRAADIDKTVYGSQKEKAQATENLIQDYLKTYGNLAGDYAKTVSDQQKFMIDARNDALKTDAQNRKDAYGMAMNYLTQFGTQNRGQLAIFEEMAGLPPGALSNQKTLKEMKKYGVASSGSLDMDFISNFVDSRMQYLNEIYGDTKPLSEKMEMVGQEFDSRFNTGKNGRNNVGSAYDYLNFNYGQYGDQQQLPSGVVGPAERGDPVYIVPKGRAIIEQNFTDFSGFDEE